jgi:hypothetical protein
MPQLPLIAASLLLLSACQEIALVGMVERNNYVTSGRSISGWALSLANDADCEPTRVFDREPVCRPKPEPASTPEPVCYRTLAAVTCYTTPHPRMTMGQRLPMTATPSGQPR